jgi:hypothetical protein
MFPGRNIVPSQWLVTATDGFASLESSLAPKNLPAHSMIAISSTLSMCTLGIIPSSIDRCLVYGI